MQLVASQCRARGSALCADDRAFHEYLWPPCIHRIEHHNGGGTTDAQRIVLRERGYPFDSGNLFVATEIAGQRNNSFSLPVGKTDENRMRQATVTVAMGYIGLADQIEDLSFFALKQRGDIGSTQRQYDVLCRYSLNPQCRCSARSVEAIFRHPQTFYSSTASATNFEYAAGSGNSSKFCKTHSSE